MIGSFGSLITFETSDQKILTFKNLRRESESRWQQHDRINKKPMPQYLGESLDTVSFTIALDARHGTSPAKIIDSIYKHRETGKPEYLVVGGTNVCKNKMVITKTSEAWDEIWNQGELVRASVDITLMEYPDQ